MNLLSFDEVWDLLDRFGMESDAALAVVEGVVIPMLPQLNIDDLMDLDVLTLWDYPPADRPPASRMLESALEDEVERRGMIPIRTKRRPST
jgi:hypothetical protein